ncbi:MAG: ferredoxin [Planctomycetota bacterium]|nr:MAG: ferredoxin [Planctomycetota bacterium]
MLQTRGACCRLAARGADSRRFILYNPSPMSELTLNGRKISFKPGQSILAAALDAQIEVPHYCYHPSLSVVANCRICLGEVWIPNAKTGKLDLIPKLVPTCQQAASEGMVVYTDSPKAVENQKAVMEYLLINHPVDCAVCDQAGECTLQDYSYEYGRGASRFEEAKNKKAKKDVGPNILLYSDRCIMCTRCVRFTSEVTQTHELMIDGRGSHESIDIFPGMPLDNELASNVIDLCPVGALLDKDFLFQQRVWFLKKTASIDGITSSGDNLSAEHNEGRIYRLKPRFNADVNKWWITDEVRYGWKFVHAEARISLPSIKRADGTREEFSKLDPRGAFDTTYAHINASLQALVKKRLALLLSPMLSCEDTFSLVRLALSIDPNATIGLGPVPIVGADKTISGFVIRAEKAPNARGVRRVANAMLAAKGNTTGILEFANFEREVASAAIGAVLTTGNYPSAWTTPALIAALAGKFVIAIDTLPNAITAIADVVLPSATWLEKSGSFESATGRLQSFDQAIEPIEFSRSEAQIGMDLAALRASVPAQKFNADGVRKELAKYAGLDAFSTALHQPPPRAPVDSDMVLVEL